MWVSNQCCILKIMGRTKVNKCCVLTTAETRVKNHPCGFSCCTFQGDGSVVVDSLFLIAPDVCGFLCLVPVFVMQYLMSFLSFLSLYTAIRPHGHSRQVAHGHSRQVFF